MRYSFKIDNPQKHFIQITIELDVHKDKSVDLQLPSWRPGRYELGDFAKNVKSFSAKDEFGNNIDFSKIRKDLWRIPSNEHKKLTISYQYYAAELNAGSTWLDENQLYINPINCCMYNPLRLDEECYLELDLPENYQIATSLTKQDHVLFASDFHVLVDSPIICSPTLQIFNYKLQDVNFHVCFQGEVKVNWDKMEKDFIEFTACQIERFGSFPVNEYYFLFQITPYASYHGVEHQRSTVILLGPSYAIFKKNYSKLLGISSHELYHTWNVKTIRPNDMLPYDYSKENYTEMGYVTEGVTTYMGDRMLFESGVFSEKDYLKELGTLLQRHFDNDGRKHYSVAESSFDTWLDGYVQGVPGRKVSIYVEGALIALICDARIRKLTQQKRSLHDVMRKMYGGDDVLKGYDKLSYKELLEDISGTSFNDIYNDLIHGNVDFKNYLETALNEFGWKFNKNQSSLISRRYGIKGIWFNHQYKINSVAEGSSADCSGLIPGDKIHSINGYKLNNDLENWLDYFKNDEVVLSIEREGELKRMTLSIQNEKQFYNYTVEKH